MWGLAAALGVIIVLLAGCFALLVAIHSKIEAYHRLNGEGPPAP
jgi:hypothetical protein